MHARKTRVSQDNNDDNDDNVGEQFVPVLRRYWFDSLSQLFYSVAGLWQKRGVW